MQSLSEFHKVHFIAIGGIGMSALARILLGRGLDVRGSDEKASHITENLVRQGAKIYIGHRKEQISDADLIVVSSAIKYENEELEEAKRIGLPIWHRSTLLKVLMDEKTSISVTGAHGKTTTSSMLTTLLIHAHMEPSAILGGELPLIHGNSCWGNGPYLVAEVDESDGSFLNLNTPYAVITNIEADHLDHYGDLDHIERAFVQYLNQIPKEGGAFLGIDSPTVTKILPQITCPYHTFGFSPEAELQARNVFCYHGGSESEIYWKGERIGILRLTVPGEYNVQNALAAISVGITLGIPTDLMLEGLHQFCSSKRRYEKIGSIGDLTFIEDYAHHPTEVRALLRAARTEKKDRVVIVFQPHLYSRTRNFRDEFGQSFKDADFVVLTDVFASREKRPEQGISGATVVEAIEQWDPLRKVLYIPQKEDLPRILPLHLQANDLVLFVGAGDINLYGKLVLESMMAKG